MQGDFNPVEFIMERSASNRQLAIELYCECYIYDHYDDSVSDSWEEPTTWFGNFCNRIKSILHDHRISIEVDTSHLQEIHDKQQLLKKYASI